MSKGTQARGFILGRMGRPIEVRVTNAGKKIGSLRLACTSGWGDNEVTSWFDVVVFDEKKVELLQKFTATGSRILVIGEMRVRKWQDKQGADRYTTECVVGFDGVVELMDSKAEREGNGQSTDGSRDQGKAADEGFGGGFGDMDDDEVPF